jgi:LmbE family N-acetylglucosaminyl deacetylase
MLPSREAEDRSRSPRAASFEFDVTEAARLFVVAAHPDDDVIGCGGTMAMTAARGDLVRVTYLTDGSRSHPGSRRFPPTEIAKIRALEACAALVELGVQAAPEFYALPDSALGEIGIDRTRETIERLAAAMRAFAPDVVVAPWRRDPHPDHMAAADLAARAFGEAAIDATFAGYDVWLSIRGDAADRPGAGETIVESVALTPPARAAKRRALFAHRSQTSDLIDDDPEGFRISAELAERWLGPSETFFVDRRSPLPT